MNNVNPSLVPLQKAGLCLDCDTITATHTNCLACGSRAMLNIARVLSQNRPPSPPRMERMTLVQIPTAHLRQRISFYKAETILDRGLGHGEVPPRRFGAENSA